MGDQRLALQQQMMQQARFPGKGMSGGLPYWWWGWGWGWWWFTVTVSNLCVGKGLRQTVVDGVCFQLEVVM